MERTEITQNLKAHFLRLYRMAISDDNFSEYELKLLYEFAEERNIPKNELDKILMNPLNIKAEVPDKIETKIEYLFELTQMIWADNEVSADERNTLEKYIKLFGFIDDNIKDIAEFMIESVKNKKSLHQIIQEIL